jgi:hypothetical protein
VLKAQRRSALQSALKAMLAEAERVGVPRTALIVDVDAMQLM